MCLHPRSSARLRESLKIFTELERYLELVSLATISLTNFHRCVWRGAHVCPQRVGCAKSCESAQEEPHGWWWETHAVQRDQHPQGNCKSSLRFHVLPDALFCLFFTSTLLKINYKVLKNYSNICQQDHPNIVKMYEFFEDAKRYYLVTE